MLSRFKWYRKLRGGIWNYNRYWYDAGTTIIFKWERKYLGKDGGPRYTAKTEYYNGKESI